MREPLDHGHHQNEVEVTHQDEEVLRPPEMVTYPEPVANPTSTLLVTLACPKVELCSAFKAIGLPFDASRAHTCLRPDPFESVPTHFRDWALSGGRCNEHQFGATMTLEVVPGGIDENEAGIGAAGGD